MSHPIDDYAMCPFYKWDDSSVKKIGCEGPADTDSLQLTFKDKGDKNAYKEKYCKSCRNWQKCPVAQMLCREYGTE